jgi:hypothetical protein
LAGLARARLAIAVGAHAGARPIARPFIACNGK